MEKAAVMVREYVKAGFTKVHLDASMSAADPSLLPDADAAERVAHFCQIGEAVPEHHAKSLSACAV